jgi:tetratricopeptide (TPR) repeat protein
MSALKSFVDPRLPLAVLLAVCGFLPPMGAAPVCATEVGRFDELSRRVQAAPADAMAGNILRKVCREEKAVERCIALFDKLAEGHPDVEAVRINAALAYVDELPNHSLYTQAKLSTHSMEHVSAILATDPDNWLALYIRGLNNLYWPIWYRRTDRAIADLAHCIRVSEGLSAARQRPYMALAYVALGDTYARLERIDEALAVWKKGARIYESVQLRDRIGAQPRMLHETIEKIRSRDVPIDTDLGVFSADLSAADR